MLIVAHLVLGGLLCACLVDTALGLVFYLLGVLVVVLEVDFVVFVLVFCLVHKGLVFFGLFLLSFSSDNQKLLLLLLQPLRRLHPLNLLLHRGRNILLRPDKQIFR